MANRELFGSSRCQHTQEMRDWLELQGRDFVEYDVEADPEAHGRFKALPGAPHTIPVLVEDGKIVQIGWQGHGCMVG
jgi:glutaredoxin